MDIKQLLHKFQSKRWFTKGIHSLVKINDARGPLTLFALYDIYGTNKAHRQSFTSEIRSRIEYSITSGDTF